MNETILIWSQLTYHAFPLFKQRCNGEQILQKVVAELAPLAAKQQITIQQAATEHWAIASFVICPTLRESYDCPLTPLAQSNFQGL